MWRACTMIWDCPTETPPTTRSPLTRLKPSRNTVSVLSVPLSLQMRSAWKVCRQLIPQFILHVRQSQFYFIFLALLDSVSRGHGMGLLSVVRPSVRFSVRPSVRPSVARFSLKLMHGFLSNFGCCFPWAICPDVFFIFEKKTKKHLTLLLPQKAFESFQTFLKFSSQWCSQKYYFGFLKF